MALHNQESREEIKIYIVTLFREEFNINLDHNINEDENFFSHKIGLSPRNMVYLFFFSEKQYNICFTEGEIESSSFYTLNGLSTIIADHIENMI